MRSPFNTHCEIFKGPLSAFPGQSAGVFSCRLVVEDGIHTVQWDPGVPIIPAYLTIEDYRPVGVFTDPKFTVYVGLADRVAVPATGPINYLVFYTDYIIWKRQKKYYRAYLMDIPYPDTGSAGVLVGGTASINPPPPITTGGVACGGFAQVIIGVHSAGVLVDGLAYVKPGSAMVSSAGVLVGGVAYVKPGSATVSSAGVLVGGDAYVKPGSATVSSAGVLVGGDAYVKPGSATVSSAGVKCGGSASVSLVWFSYVNFATGLHNFVLNFGTATGSGIADGLYNFGGDFYRFCEVQITVASTAHLTSIAILFDQVAGAQAGTVINYIGVIDQTAPNRVATSAVTTGTGKTLSWSGTVNTTYWYCDVSVGHQIGSDPGGSCLLKSMTISGTGVKPPELP